MKIRKTVLYRKKTVDIGPNLLEVERTRVGVLESIIQKEVTSVVLKTFTYLLTHLLLTEVRGFTPARGLASKQQ